MISVLIPALHEQYLQHTINDILSKVKGDIEVIVCLDGYWPNPQLIDDKRVKVIHHSVSKGMRYSINSAARMAKGKYLLKCDAHCMFAEGFDEVLVRDCQSDWTLVPIRYSLDPVSWKPKFDKKYEFEYISSDDLKGKRWPEYAKRVEGQVLPDLMTFQGSCWFMHRKRFFDLGGLDEVNYGGMGREAQEVCLKSWLSGGKCVLDRRTWYAHWSKSKGDINFSCREEKQKSVAYAKDLWLNNKWSLQKRDLSWLVDRFHPVPSWDQEPEELKEKGQEMVLDNGLIVKEGMTRAGLYRHFAKLEFRIGAEIGVQRGRNALVMFQNIPDLKLFLVDPYDDHSANKRRWGEKAHAKFKRMAHKRLKEAGYNQVQWLEAFSEQAAYNVPDKSLDFVYIDGEHTYDYVMIDIILWSRKVRSGGIVSGHDFEYRGGGVIKKDPKVAHALMDYVKAYKINPIYLTDKQAVGEHPGDGCPSWFWVKR